MTRPPRVLIHHQASSEIERRRAWLQALELRARGVEVWLEADGDDDLDDAWSESLNASAFDRRHIAEFMADPRLADELARVPEQEVYPAVPHATNDEETARLLYLLGQRVSGVKLVMVRSESSNVLHGHRGYVVNALRSANIDVETVELGRGARTTNILSSLERANERSRIIFVTGLEALLLEDGIHPQPSDAMARFNFDRDLLIDRLSGIVVFWMSTRAARAFAELARDTLSVFATVFELPAETSEIPAASFASDAAVLDILPLWFSDPDRLIEVLPPRFESGAGPSRDVARIDYEALRLRRALRSFDAVALHDASADPSGAAWWRCLRARLWADIEVWDEVEHDLDLALDLAIRGGGVGRVLEVHLHRHAVECARGRLDEALACLIRFALWQLDLPLEPARRMPLLMARAELERRRGEFAASRHTLELELAPLAASFGDSLERARIDHSLALTLAHQREFEAALRLLHDRVLPSYGADGEWSSHARAVVVVADILEALGDAASSRDLLRREALPHFVQCRSARDVWRARTSLARLERIR